LADAAGDGGRRGEKGERGNGRLASSGPVRAHPVDRLCQVNEVKNRRPVSPPCHFPRVPVQLVTW
jgi:hypothetical protein